LAPSEGFDFVMRRRLGNVVSPLVYRFVDGHVRPGRRAAFASLIRSGSGSMEQLRQRQERLLRRLLAHARQDSPWYRGRLGEADIAHFRLDELASLPILERSHLQDHLDEIAGSGKFMPGAREAYSSGSTGTPVRLYQSQEFRDYADAEIDRGYLACIPFRLGMPRAHFWGSEIDSRAHRGVTGTARDVLGNMLWFNAFALRRDGLAATARRLRAFRPALVIGYVSILSEVAGALGRPLEGLAAIVTSAETLSPQERTAIERAFGAPVFNRYGTREVGTLAQECESHDGLHLSMENNIVEIVGSDGRPLTTPGDEGEILVTNLRNLATPVIRLRLGDIARLGRDGCTCGRASSRLESVLGRTSDLIVTPGGGLLHGLFFMRVFYNTPVHRFRVEQETLRRLRVRVVPAADYTDGVRQRVTSLIQTRGDPNFEVIWEVMDEIPPSPSGKFRYTVSHLSGSAANPARKGPRPV
jgi:phenylacetate-CoA ligase